VYRFPYDGVQKQQDAGIVLVHSNGGTRMNAAGKRIAQLVSRESTNVAAACPWEENVSSEQRKKRDECRRASMKTDYDY
jgi:hypothetical protein